VRTVLSAGDIPQIRFGTAIKTAPCSPRRGPLSREAIAAVAATSLEVAEAAVRAIEVEYEPCPRSSIPRGPVARRAAGPCRWSEYQALPVFDREGNISAVRRSAAATSRRVSPVVSHLRTRFTTQHVHPGYTEPRAAVASWDGNGDVIVWSNTQLPFDMKNICEVLDLPASKVRVIVPGIGGGFGGKLRVGVEHYAAWLARKSRRPVKVITTSEEELTDAYPRQPTVVT